MNKAKINVLFISANPRTTAPIEVVKESEVILESLERSRYRDDISIQPRHLATVHKLRRALLDNDFEIVHISGHGTDMGIVFEKEDGTPHIVPQEALADLFQAYSPPIQCVILNACFSVEQGKLISLGIPFTIAMEGQVADQAAIEFSRGFYDAIGAGKDIRFSYEEGCRTVRLVLSGTRFSSRILTGGDNRLALVDLFSSDAARQIRAARWIGTARQEAAVPSLVRSLETTSDPETRYWTIVALGQIGTVQAKHELQNLYTKFDTDKLAIQDALKLDRRQL